MESIYDIYEWDIEGIPSEFFFLEDENYILGHEEELWKRSVIPGLWVSTDQRFYSDVTKRFYIPTHGDGHGHKAIKITMNGIHTQAYAHRLLALAFIPNPHNYPIVRHLNDDPDNNDISNLAWGTQLHNHLDAVENGTYKKFSDEHRKKSHELMDQPVELTNIKTNEKLYFNSIANAARTIGAQQANLWKVLNGTRSQTVGYSGRKITKEEYYAQTN